MFGFDINFMDSLHNYNAFPIELQETVKRNHTENPAEARKALYTNCFASMKEGGVYFNVDIATDILILMLFIKHSDTGMTLGELLYNCGWNRLQMMELERFPRDYRKQIINAIKSANMPINWAEVSDHLWNWDDDFNNTKGRIFEDYIQAKTKAKRAGFYYF